MVHGKNRIPYWIDRRLTGLAGPEYDATISFGLPFESEDCPYGESRLLNCALPTRLVESTYGHLGQTSSLSEGDPTALDSWGDLWN